MEQVKVLKILAGLYRIVAAISLMVKLWSLKPSKLRGRHCHGLSGANLISHMTVAEIFFNQEPCNSGG